MMILASRSPDRRRILETLGVPFVVVPSSFDEAAIREQDPVRRALLLAEGKASNVVERYPDRCVIGVDTLVVAADGSLLEKPADAEDARRMLALQAGTSSTVHTALCIQEGERCHTACSSARVIFKRLTEEDIAWWLGTELWRGRSGAFQAEGEGQALIAHIDGEVETVVGFPVRIFLRMYRSCGLYVAS